jgi:hypothetical protein
MDEAERLMEKLPELEERARRVGLYLEGSAVVQSQGRPLLVTRMLLGDVAFTKRVQNPDADDVDRELEEMTARIQDDEFLDARQRIARNVAEGRDPLDDGDKA